MIIEADCVQAMAEMPEASVDAIVCDPPYGLEFMGKEWDRLGDQRQPRELVVNESPHRRTSTGSGVSYGGLASYGANPARVGRKMQEWHEAWAREALRVLKPGGHLLAFGGTRTYHRLACAIEDAGFEIRDCLAWLYGSGFPKSHNLNGDWQGWGTALKPAHEPIVMARKPLAGTVAQNVVEHGTGALNVDGCRIEGASGNGHWTHRREIGDGNIYSPGGRTDEDFGNVNPANGRWPANVLLDEQAAEMLDEQTGESQSIASSRGERHGAIYGNGAGPTGPDTLRGHNDSGGASRFLYVAKASSAERNAGLDGFEERETRTYGDMGPDENARPNGQAAMVRQNVHPTVKPIELMRWLVRLVTPPSGTVLDPFTGSGTTGIAAGLEGLNFIGIEREPEYAAIARARIAWWAQHPDGLELVKALEADRERKRVAESGQLGLLP